MHADGVASVHLDAYVTETSFGLIRSYVETNDSRLVVEELKILHEEEKPSFWQRHWLKLGIGAGLITCAFLK
jgi:hypothetical protein